MINKNGEVLMDISIKKLDKINELVIEHKKITDALSQNLTYLCQYKFEPKINIGEVGVNQPKEGKSYEAYSFEISFNKADEINEIINEHQRLLQLLFDNMSTLRFHDWSVEIMEVEEKQPPLE